MQIRRILPPKLTAESLVRFVLCLYFAISIFEPYLNGILGSVTKYYIFFVMIVLLWQDGFRLKIRRLSLVYVAWLLLKIVSLLWSEDFSTPKLHIVSQLGMVMYLVVLLSYKSDEKMMDAIEMTYWLSSLAMGVLAILFSEAYGGREENRLVLVVMDVEIDPNNQAALLLTGIALSLNNLLYQKRRIWFSALGLIINCYGCFQTASRASFMTLGVLALFCILCSPKKRKPGLVFRNAVLLCGAIMVLYYAAIHLLPKANFIRLFDFSGYEGGSNRVVLWRNAWSVYTDRKSVV